MSIMGVSIHWTGLLDWNTGLDYWTEIFSFFGQVCVVICRKMPTFFTINKYLATVDDCNNNKSCLL